MIVHDFHIVRVAVCEPEHQTPGAVDRYRPMSRTASLEHVQTHAFQHTQALWRNRSIQLVQPEARLLLVQSCEPVPAAAGELFGRPIPERPDHDEERDTPCVSRQSCLVWHAEDRHRPTPSALRSRSVRCLPGAASWWIRTKAWSVALDPGAAQRGEALDPCRLEGVGSEPSDHGDRPPEDGNHE